MAENDFSQLTIDRWLDDFSSGRARAAELVDYYLARIAERNSALNVYLEVFAADARQAAAAADRRRARGEPPRPLEAVPLAIKDNILIQGRRTTAGSKILENYVAPYEATAVRRLRAAGAIILGRTNLDEFAMGSSTENSAFGPTKNPADPTRVAGGSSGGSAAAVAADLALAALGSETGGSVRQPAAFCGVVGLKPSYGAVSRFGLVALASSLDGIGPLARTAADAARIFAVIGGADENDATSSALKNNPPAGKSGRLRVGRPRGFFDEGLAPAAAQSFAVAVRALGAAGYQILDIDLPTARYALAAYYVIMPAEASSNLARYDGLRYGAYLAGADLIDDYRRTRGAGFGPEARRRIILGTYVLSAGYYDTYYGRAVAVRETIKREFAEAFRRVDVIITPTAPTAAFPIGERAADPLEMYLADLFTVPANLTGLPALSVPIRDSGSRLPLGLQLIAPAGGEDQLFQIAEDYAHL